MKRVLLTGANGFIGRHCLPLLLKSGYEVHAVSSKASPPDSGLAARWHQVNLLEPAAVSHLLATVRPTHLMHLAWYTAPGRYWSSPENFRWVQASLHLFQEFAAHGGERVVVAGSCAEYEWKQPGFCSELQTPLAPATLYGACKHALHVMLDAFARQAGMSAAWGRIFFLYGPHEHPERLVASVICSLLQNRAARCSHAQQVRDFLYVEDVAAAFVALLESNVGGPVNIASGHAVTLQDVLDRIGEKLGRRELILLGARPAPSNEPPVLRADARRLNVEVGWQPQYDLDLGLERTIDWWRANLGGAALQDNE